MATLPMGDHVRSLDSRASTRSGRLYIAPWNWLLTAVFVGLFAFWLTGDGVGLVEERDVRPLFEVFDADRAQLVVLERPDAAAVETNGIERSTLVLKPTAGSAGEADWALEELYGATAFRDRVERLLSRVGSMTTLDLVSADPARHDEYGLGEERALRIRVSIRESMEDTPMVDLLLAPAPERGAWVRKWGESEVWRIARFSPPSPSPSAWFDDSSLMPLGDRAIRSIRASGRAVDRDVAILSVPGGERFVDEAGVSWDVPRVPDLHRRLQTLFPVTVTAAKAEGEPLLLDGEGAPEGQPWLRLEVGSILSEKPFHIELAEPEEGAKETRAVLVEGTIRVTVASRTVREIALSLQALLDAQGDD